MADATPFDVIESLQNTLDDNIDDPNPDRTGSDRWIYTAPIKYDIADYPRIHIHHVDDTHQSLSVGSTEREIDSRIQVSIFQSTGRSNKLDIDDDNDLEEPVEVIDFLADKVVTQINDNQSTWRSLGQNIFYVLTEQEQRIQDESNSVIQHTIDAIIKHER